MCVCGVGGGGVEEYVLMLAYCFIGKPIVTNYMNKIIVLGSIPLFRAPYPIKRLWIRIHVITFDKVLMVGCPF